MQYSRSQLVKLLEKVEKNLDDSEGDEDELDNLVLEFEEVSEHPEGSNLIFWPKPGADDSLEGIIAEVERWRAENGLPI